MKNQASAGRVAVILVAAALLTAVIAGCGSSGGSTGGGTGESGVKPVAGGQLRVATFAEPITLNPFEAVDTGSEEVFMQILEPLFQTVAGGKVEPWLATEAKPSNDYKTWTLPLRSGVKFTDGKPLTAEDVVFSLEEITKSLSWGSLYEVIEGVKAKSPTEVEITTSKPFPSLTAVLALPFAAIVEKDYGGMTAKEFAQNPVGTGPFELGGWKHGQSITLAKNPHYWQSGKPYLEKVALTFPSSDEARVLGLRGGQSDVIASPPNSQVGPLEQTPGLRVEKSPDDLAFYLVLNAKNELLSNPKIKEAIDLAVDREAIVKAAWSGNATLGGSWLMPAVNYWDKSIEAPTLDPQKAKELVSEAVEEEGLSPKFTLLIGSGSAFNTLASQIIQEDLKKAGLEMQIKSLDSAAAVEAETTGNFDATLEGLSTDIVEPSESVSFYIGLKAFFTEADTSTMTKLLNEALVESDPAKLRTLYSEMQQYVADNKELITLGYVPWTWALTDKVAGFQLNAMGLPFYVNAGFTK